ncbi:MAG: hypothetical protein WBF43_00850 [Methylocella sp.]
MGTKKKGYDVHHIVEQTAADREGYSEAKIDGPENLVSIPRLKHWEITAWFMRGKNKDYDYLSPCAYLQGKSWEERRKVGPDALKRFKVLKP